MRVYCRMGGSAFDREARCITSGGRDFLEGLP